MPSNGQTEATESTALLSPLSPFGIPFNRSCYSTSSVPDAILREMKEGRSGAVSPMAQTLPCLAPDNVTSMTTLFSRQRYMSHSGTMWSTSFNLACGTLGAGTLALPHAVRHSGALLATALLGLICWCTIYSVYLIGKVYDITRLGTFEELVYIFVSPQAAKLAIFFVVAFCWGTAIMYIVMMGDFLGPVLTALQPYVSISREMVMLIFWGCVMLPLSMLRDFTSLQFSSIISTTSTIVLTIALLIKLYETPIGTQDVKLVSWNSETLSALSTFLFSYCCQPAVLSVYKEMKNATIRRLTIATSTSMCLCTLLYVLCGISGSLVYGNSTEPNILSNFGTDLSSPSVALSYVGMACSVTLAFPMAIFPGRDSVLILMGYAEKSKTPDRVVRLTGAILAFLALLLGYMVPSIYFLFDVLGGLCGGIICFVFPGVVALRVFQVSQPQLSRFHMLMTWVIIIFGFLMCLLGSFNSIRINLTDN